MNNLKESGGKEVLDIKSMIINRPQNSTLGFRLRDIFFNLATLVLWGFLIFKVSVFAFSSNSVWQSEFERALGVLSITFFTIFFVIYLWVNCEKISARRRMSKYAKGKVGFLISYDAPPEASHWHSEWQEKWLVDFQAQTDRIRANRTPINDSEHAKDDFLEIPKAVSIVK